MRKEKTPKRVHQKKNLSLHSFSLPNHLTGPSPSRSMYNITYSQYLPHTYSILTHCILLDCTFAFRRMSHPFNSSNFASIDVDATALPESVQAFSNASKGLTS